jgi:hypothetical protein
MIHTAVLTWRYWIQYVRRSQFYVQDKNLNDSNNKTLPSRFHLEIFGMEVFVYNRSGAYDQIEEILKNESLNNKRHSHMHRRSSSRQTQNISRDASTLKYRKSKSSTNTNTSSINEKFDRKENEFMDDTSSNESDEPKEVMDSTFLDFLPVEIVINKGSFVLGNEKTPSLYVASFSTMNGQIDATLPGSPLDYYRTHYDFTVSNLKLDLKRNVSFKDINSLEKKMNEIKNKKKTKNFISMISGLGSSIKRIQYYYNKSPSTKPKKKNINSTLFEDSDNYSNEKGFSDDNEEWHGLERYLTTVSSSDSDLDSTYDYEKFKLMNTEYAKFSNILETQICNINYYYDSQGLVPSKKISIDYVEDPDIGNKDIPPMFGVDITVYGTTIVYGPWAEKQRGQLHQLLFPPLYRNSIPFQKLKTGMRRQYVSFDLSIQCGDELVFRIPHREESKDILLMKNDLRMTRPFGWLNLKLSKGSITDLSVSLIATKEKGTDNKINCVFVKPEISTSVNHDILFEADEHILNASIAFPLGWNSLADWKFENISKNPNIFLLREHITLLSDLFSDFSSGEPTPYELFRPFIYRFNWKMYDYTIYMNINEANIINNPLDSSINTYLTFSGSFLNLNVKIPLTSVYKKSNTVDFLLETSYFDLAVEHPASSTFSNFMQTEVIGNANNFKMKGSYTYFSFMEIDAIDTIILDCTCDDTTVKLYGFVIKYFLSMKENYFGDSTHFQNLLEFRDNFDKKDKNILHEGRRMKNETDLMISFCVNNGCLALPCHFYDCTSHISLHFAELDIDLRNNNYYMDLQANFSEVRGRYIEECDESVIFINTQNKVEFEPDILIDDLSIHGIRIFGLPPTEPTYFCRWDFDSNGITIDSEPIFLNALSRAGCSFKFGHKDLENSLSLPVSSVMDILNLSFRCPMIDIKLKNLDYILRISLIDLFLKLSDQPTTIYNSLLNLIIKDIIIDCEQNEIQLLKLITSIEIKDFIQKKDAFERMKEQAMHLKKHDASYHRTPFLIPEFAKDRKYFKGINSITSSLNLPDPPLPLTNQSVEMIINSFPEHIKTKLANISSACDDDDDYLDDLHNFDSNLEDFDVLEKLNVDCSYHNVPIKFNKIEIFVSPAMAPAFASLLTSMTDFNMYSILDQLQSDFIDFYQYKQENTVFKCKIECPVINLKISETFASMDYLFLGINDLIFAIAKSSVDSISTLNLYAIIKELNFDIIKDTEDVLLTTFYNILLKQSTEKKKISTIDIEDISFFIEPIHTPWMLELVFQYKSFIDQTIKELKSFKRDTRASLIELLYNLSRAGIDYNISHDPPCITKPSYIASFSEKHIRMDGNWMIIPRLRHVLQNLPADWIVEKNQLFKERIWEAPGNAEDDVAMIFGNWRCWDNHKTKDNFIFKKVFHSEEEAKMKLLTAFKLTLKSFSLSINPFKNLFVTTNFFLFLNRDNLSKKVQGVALPLLDVSIQHCLDVSLKIDSAVLSFTKISRILNQYEGIYENLQTVLKLHTSGDLQSTDENDGLASTASLNEVSRYEPVAPLLITINFSLNEYSYSFGIDKTILTLYGQGTTFTSSMITTEKLLSCTLNYKNQFFSTEFYVDKIPILEFTCESHTSTLVNTGSFLSGKTALFFSNEHINVNFLPTTKQLIKAITIFIEDDCSYLIPLLKKGSNISTDEVPKVSESSESSSICSMSESIMNKLRMNIFRNIKFNLSASIKTAKVNFHFELISPFFTNFELSNPSISFKLGAFGLLTQYLADSSKLFVGSQNGKFVFEYFTLTTESLKFLLAALYNEEVYQVLTKLVIGLVRLNFSHNNLVTIIHKAQSDSKVLTKNLKMLKQRIEKTVGLFTEKTTEKIGKPTDYKNMLYNFEKFGAVVHLIFDFHFSNILLKTNINGNKLSLDCIKPRIVVQTYDNNLKKFSPHGNFSLPSTRVSIGLNGVHGMSTIFDVQLVLEVTNPPNLDSKLKKLEVTTDYLRFVLNEHIVEELIEAYGDIAVLLETKTKKPDILVENINFEEKINSIFSFFSINILAKNVCFGWLFNEDDSECSTIAPGIILGFEDTLISCAKGAGKIQSRGMYFSTARGFTASTFYSVKSEKLSENRAYFPLFNLIYTVYSDSRFLKFRAQVDGEQIDFKFQTNILSMTEPLWSSITALQDKFSHVQQMLRRKLERSEKLNSQSTLDNSELVETSRYAISSGKIFTFSCIFKFAGASFFIYNSNIEINGTIPILRLQSPRLSSVFKYTYDIFALKKHAVLFSALISETNNKLSCLCVPVLQDIIRGLRRLMKKSNKHSLTEPINADDSDSDSNDDDDNSNNLDFVNLSKKIDVNLSIKIEPQRLELTCEPRANIEAEVVLEDIHLIIKTDQDFLSGVLLISGVRSELKHAYSKVTSGSIHVNKLLLNSTMATIDFEKKFSTVAKVDSLDAFINMQQRQDLDLFKDFWWPNEFSESFVVRKNDANIDKKTFASMLREVSTTSAFPWVLSFVISRVSTRIALGTSLGEIYVDIEKFIALSTKSLNWDHNLKFSFDCVRLESKGRLSGMLRAKQIRITSAISWKRDGRALTIPLVLLSFGIGCLQTKISLDYHPFFVLEIIKLSATMYNQRQNNAADKLKNSFTIESLRIFMTALTASNFVDVYTIGLRIRQDIKVSYKQVLNEAQINLSNRTKDTCKNILDENLDHENQRELTPPSQTFLSMIEKLKTYLNVNVGLLEVQIFPSSLLDSQAMVITIGKQNASFYQYNNVEIENRISLDLADITVSLSSFKKRPTLESLTDSTDIKSYVELASTSIPDNIFVFPSLKISMDTIQNLDDNIIKYKYYCKFDGKVDIKWKIGSVYFIRQMWYSHATTLSNRLIALRIYTSDENIDEMEENYKQSALESVNLEDRLKDVESDKKYIYDAIVEPNIETPQLKDLGSATPPLEWFGLHRDKFPNLTHQVAILGVQKIIKEVEARYSKVLK